MISHVLHCNARAENTVGMTSCCVHNDIREKFYKPFRARVVAGYGRDRKAASEKNDVEVGRILPQEETCSGARSR